MPDNFVSRYHLFLSHLRLIFDVKAETRFPALLFSLFVLVSQVYFPKIILPFLKFVLQAFNKYLSLEMSYFDDPLNSTGALTTRLATDASRVQERVTFL